VYAGRLATLEAADGAVRHDDGAVALKCGAATGTGAADCKPVSIDPADIKTQLPRVRYTCVNAQVLLTNVSIFSIGLGGHFASCYVTRRGASKLRFRAVPCQKAVAAYNVEVSDFALAKALKKIKSRKAHMPSWVSPVTANRPAKVRLL
jgi:hypothetical protein